jgi:hypothetical protein
VNDIPRENKKNQILDQFNRVYDIITPMGIQIKIFNMTAHQTKKWHRRMSAFHIIVWQGPEKTHRDGLKNEQNIKPPSLGGIK